MKLFFLIILLSPSAHAYIPPVHWMAQKIARDRPNPSQGLITISVFKPSTVKQAAPEILAQFKLTYNIGAEWPALATLLEPNPKTIQEVWKNFGISVPTEAELLTLPPEQYKVAEQLPQPFYKINPEQQLRRFPGGIAYVSKGAKNERSVWIDKNALLPIRLAGACPAAVNELAWIKGKETNCQLDFDRFFYKANQARPFQMTFRGERQDLLVLRIDGITLNVKDARRVAKESQANLAELPAPVHTLLETLLGL